MRLLDQNGVNMKNDSMPSPGFLQVRVRLAVTVPCGISPPHFGHRDRASSITRMNTYSA